MTMPQKRGQIPRYEGAKNEGVLSGTILAAIAGGVFLFLSFETGSFWWFGGVLAALVWSLIAWFKRPQLKVVYRTPEFRAGHAEGVPYGLRDAREGRRKMGGQMCRAAAVTQYAGRPADFVAGWCAGYAEGFEAYSR